mmetsp:Transcript_24710/g.49150  ORF Transcript_24710/g.49150 Transcript_24710/m.49150 type:complete len:210 (-) Transcript_24710:663-1292(-)
MIHIRQPLRHATYSSSYCCPKISPNEMLQYMIDLDSNRHSYRAEDTSPTWRRGDEHIIIPYRFSSSQFCRDVMEVDPCSKPRSLLHISLLQSMPPIRLYPYPGNLPDARSSLTSLDSCRKFLKRWGWFAPPLILRTKISTKQYCVVSSFPKLWVGFNNITKPLVHIQRSCIAALHPQVQILHIPHPCALLAPSHERCRHPSPLPVGPHG